MTNRKLTALGRAHMKRLEMHEWLPRAEFKIVRLNGLCGESSWHSEERQCWIAVAPASDAVMEETLIHELLHVLYEGHLPPVGMGEAYYDASYELGLNRTAKALMEAWNRA